MTKISLYFASLLLGTNFSASTPPMQTATTLTNTTPVTEIEQQFIDLVNEERWNEDLGVLSVNPLLVQIAREHSREMAEKNYFDHYSPTPGLKTPMDRYLSSYGKKPTWAYLGENLFYCSIVDVQRGHKAFMGSPKHRENILNPRYEQIGVGVFIGKDGKFWVTQMFLSQID